MQHPKTTSPSGRRQWERWFVPLLLSVLALFVAACGSDSNSDSDGGDSSAKAAKLDFPDTFPNFDAKYLTALPTDNWITNGGTVANQRYSPLDDINDGNVKDLKGEWKVDLNSGIEAKYSHEEQPIEYNGTLYVPTGEDDVFAVDVKTGKEKWKYEGNLDPTISTVCCGWLSRGVAIGDGKVYIGKLDGHMVALDQETGKVAWDVEVANWKKDNAGITAAPLYYDGKIYTGITGGEFGVRGRLTALDAKTGKEDWRFYTVADPSQDDNGPQDPKASSTWAGDSALTGGAPIWQTPSIDPKLGMIYFTTGNANPDVDGSARAGDNLYSSSFVALDVKTGEYKWHWQAVHHDIWDYDMPSPTVLFDAKVDGKKVPAIAEAAKTGWVYALNRKTGKPIWDIEETPVPQSAQQKTAETQPIPKYPSFSDHEIDDKEFATVSKMVRDNPEGKNLKIVRGTGTAGSVFQPGDSKTVAVIANGATGGTNWQPSSYSPDTKYMYVCSTNGVEGVFPSGVDAVKPGEVRIGSILTALPFSTPGSLAAIDTKDGSIKWKKDFNESCYSGSVTTAGNLVFVGRNTGELEAYSADKGDLLWSFQTGAGANSTVTPFEHDGKEYIAVVAGGNSLAATVHGDNLWLFSLDGKLEQFAGLEGSPECGKHAGEATDCDVADAKAGGATPSDNAGDTDTNANGGDSANNNEEQPGENKAGEDDGTTENTSDVNGAEVFGNNCSVCHGAGAKGGNGGPDITNQDDIQHITNQVEHGGGGMPAFGDTLSDEQIAAVAKYVASL
ncbi:MAG: quinonprotein alcohol dehydrogenase [Thermoleophilia bacterium]|nr:quinonprotein alcohol dehydrogenase [Thermoleophilia bacterium]